MENDVAKEEEGRRATRKARRLKKGSVTQRQTLSWKHAVTK